MKLHPIKGDGRRVMCGPAALATVTGKSIAKVKEAVYFIKGRRYVCGMYNDTLIKSFFVLGYRVTDHHKYSKVEVTPTLNQWIKARAPYMKKGTYVLQVGHHYVTVSGRMFNDNWTMTPVPCGKAPHKRKRVKAYWRLEKGLK